MENNKIYLKLYIINQNFKKIVENNKNYTIITPFPT